MGAPRLLLVEDDPALAELLEFRFQGEGYKVRVTADGDDAHGLAGDRQAARAHDARAARRGSRASARGRRGWTRGSGGRSPAGKRGTRS